MSKKSKTKTETPSTCTVQPQARLEKLYYFPSPVYKMNLPDYLEVVKEVSEDHIKEIRAKGLEGDALLYPHYMSMGFQGDPRVLDFGNYVAQTAWNILKDQGYDMEKYTTHFSEMWMQEHLKYSSMDEHVHPNVSLVGFYILEAPVGSSRVIFHDPRPGKVMQSLMETNMGNATDASTMINFPLASGDLFFAPAWLPHSFTRHGSDEPLRFVHFNVFAQPVINPQPAISEVEII